MAFPAYTGYFYVISGLLSFIFGIISIYLWKKRKKKKYSSMYLIGGMILLVIFLAIILRILIN